MSWQGEDPATGRRGPCANESFAPAHPGRRLDNIQIHVIADIHVFQLHAIKRCLQDRLLLGRRETPCEIDAEFFQ
jgi:hypothetical protein